MPLSPVVPLGEVHARISFANIVAQISAAIARRAAVKPPTTGYGGIR
jgi:hypothetical protein